MKTAYCVLTCLTCLLWVLPAAANPLPGDPVAYFFHVTSGPPDVATCEELIQYTEAEGILDFYLFAYSGSDELSEIIEAAGARVVWPTDWALLDMEVFGNETTSSIGANSAELTVLDPAAPWIGDELVPIAHFTMSVDGFGELRLDGEPENWIQMFGYDYGPERMGGQAGVECAYCYLNCDLTVPRKPMPDPRFIWETVEQNHTQDFTIESWFAGFGPITMDVDTTVPWLSAVAVQTDDDHFAVTATIDATGLEVGWHDGYVSLISDCVTCVPVTVYVFETVAVEFMNWGDIKALWR